MSFCALAHDWRRLRSHPVDGREVWYGLRHTCRKCRIYGTFHKLENRRAFSCAHCGDHVYPTAGTILQDTRTPLQVWFYAIYLFATTRHGVSGKEQSARLG
jgi:transposase